MGIAHSVRALSVRSVSSRHRGIRDAWTHVPHHRPRGVMRVTELQWDAQPGQPRMDRQENHPHADDDDRCVRIAPEPGEDEPEARARARHGRSTPSEASTGCGYHQCRIAYSMCPISPHSYGMADVSNAGDRLNGARSLLIEDCATTRGPARLRLPGSEADWRRRSRPSAP
jgi:hypothetical protein